MNPFRNMDTFAADCLVLRQMIDAGIVNSNVGQIDYPQLVRMPVLDYSDRVFRQTGTPNTSQVQNAGVSPKSIRYRDSSRGRQVHPSTAAPYLEWSVELARFRVPYGYVGIVKGFEQYLAQKEELENPAFVYTQNSRWGIPGPWHTGINEISDSGVWHFRLRAITRNDPPWWNAIGGRSLPDLPYTDWPEERNLWWPAGSCASQNIHLIIPAGHMLRVIYRTPAQDVRLEVAAHLKGYIQSDRIAEMALNTRTNW